MSVSWAYTHRISFGSSHFLKDKKGSVCFPGSGDYLHSYPINWKSDDHADYALPTTVTYSDTGETSIGLTVTDAEVQGFECFRHFKLRALGSATSKDLIESVSRLSAKSADTLLRDYLMWLRPMIGVAVTQLSRGDDPRDDLDVDFMFSVPSVIAEDGISVLAQAVRAVFECVGHKHMVLDVEISEAEAAAAGALHYLPRQLQVGPWSINPFSQIPLP
jgi:hypothetical protein